MEELYLSKLEQAKATHEEKSNILHKLQAKWEKHMHILNEQKSKPEGESNEGNLFHSQDDKERTDQPYVYEEPFKNNSLPVVELLVKYKEENARLAQLIDEQLFRWQIHVKLLADQDEKGSVEDPGLPETPSKKSTKSKSYRQIFEPPLHEDASRSSVLVHCGEIEVYTPGRLLGGTWTSQYWLLFESHIDRLASLEDAVHWLNFLDHMNKLTMSALPPDLLSLVGEVQAGKTEEVSDQDDDLIPDPEAFPLDSLYLLEKGVVSRLENFPTLSVPFGQGIQIKTAVQSLKCRCNSISAAREWVTSMANVVFGAAAEDEDTEESVAGGQGQEEIFETDSDEGEI